MPGVTKEQIQAAREADLFTYLQFHEPGVLKQDGPNFRHKEHDSLVYVTGKRYWYWNSRGRSINALDTQSRFEDMVARIMDVHAHSRWRNPGAKAYRVRQKYRYQRAGKENIPTALSQIERCATAAVSYLRNEDRAREIHLRQCLQAGDFYEARYHEEPVLCVVGKDLDSRKQSLPPCTQYQR